MSEHQKSLVASILEAKAAREAEARAGKSPEQLAAEERAQLNSEKDGQLTRAKIYVTQDLRGVSIRDEGPQKGPDGVTARAIGVGDRHDYRLSVSWEDGPYVVQVKKHGRDGSLSVVFKKEVAWPLPPWPHHPDHKVLATVLMEAIAVMYEVPGFAQP